MNFNIRDFEKIEKIGEGAYGKIYLMRKNNKSFVVKKIKKNQYEELSQPIQTQIDLLSSLNVPFITKYLGQCQDKYFYLFFEFVQGGDLLYLLEGEIRLKFQQVQFYSAQIVEIIHYLHDQSIVYRDLKLSNLLIDTQGYLKLSDFDLAKKLKKTQNSLDGDKPQFLRTQTLCGTPQYMAPELVKKEPYGFSVDYWSLGICIFEMLVGKVPFNDEDPIKVYEKIIEGKVYFTKKMDERAKSLLKILLIYDQNKRYVFGREIHKHKFFKSVSLMDMRNREIKAEFVPKVDDSKDVDYFPEYSRSLDSEDL